MKKTKILTLFLAAMILTLALFSPLSALAIENTVDVTTNHISTGTPSGTGWSWDATTATLALTSAYTGELIRINAGDNSPVNLTFSGPVSVSSSGAYALIAQRPFTINGTGTLTLSHTSSLGGALYSLYALTISGGTIVANSSGVNSTINAAGGITVSGNSNLSATNAGTGDTVLGNLTVSGASAAVTVNGDITGNLDVSGGTVTVTGTISGTTTHTGGTINGYWLTITSANSAAFTVGTAGTFTVTASNSPTSFAQIGVALPGGVTFDTATGILSGTPAAGTDGTYALIFTADNLDGTSAPQNFTLTVNPAGTTTPPPGPSGSSGGCDAGFGALGALAALFAVSMGRFYKKNS